MSITLGNGFGCFKKSSHFAIKAIEGFSIGYLASFIGMLTTGLMAKQGLPMPLALFVGLLTGAFVGFVNGLIVTMLRISSIVAT